MPSDLSQKNISFCLLEDLDQLDALFPKLTKQKIKKSLGRGRKRSKFGFKGEEIELPLNLVNDGMINPQYQGPEVEIIYEDENFIVFNKPHHIYSHPLSYLEYDNLLSYMRCSHLEELLQVNHEQYDRGLIHRLDYVTSGLLIYAKNNELYQYVRNSFNKMAHQKIYYALVSGKFSLEGVHKQWFSYKGSKKKEVFVRQEKEKDSFEGVMNTSRVSFDENKNFSLLKVELETGLRHQIRAGLANLGFPIIGDYLYGGVDADFVHLHAYQYQLNLMDYVGKKYFFETKKPLWVVE